MPLPDVLACLNIYNLLQELNETGNYEVENLPVEALEVIRLTQMFRQSG